MYSQTMALRTTSRRIVLLCTVFGAFACVETLASPDDKAPPAGVALRERYDLEEGLQMRVNRAVSRGVRYLRSMRMSDGSWGRTFLGTPRPGGPVDGKPLDPRMPDSLGGELDTTALCGLVLAEHGYLPEARSALLLLQKHLERVARSTHAAALTLLLAHEVSLDCADSQKLRQALIEGQQRDGFWSYRLKDKARGAPNLQVSYWAAMGLLTGHEVAPTKDELRGWERLRATLVQGEGKGGGWDYGGRSRAPRHYFQGAFMGIAVLDGAVLRLQSETGTKSISKRRLRQTDAVRSRVLARVERDVDTLLTWLQDPSLQKPRRGIKAPYHTLLVMRRTCDALNSNAIDARKWYEHMARLLVDWQGENGVWPIRPDVIACSDSPLTRTALALLCLRQHKPPEAPDVPEKPVTPGVGEPNSDQPNVPGAPEKADGGK